MKFWYDFEFIENGVTIDPISIGMVAEDGRELYLVNGDAAWGRILEHSWLMENVIPYLEEQVTVYPDHMFPNWSHPSVRDKSELANEVREFLQFFSETPTELWAWYGAYDHVALAQLWGTMINIPNGIPMWTNDVRQWAHQLGNPVMPAQDAKEHHALADARHTKQMYDYCAMIAARR